jgi:hypothetical protein
MGDGDRLYSYGNHYPLLFRVASKGGRMLWVVNDGGYSATTSKHIAYARAHADITAPIGGRGYGAQAIDRADVIASKEARMRTLHATMQAKKRKDTATYKALEAEYVRHAQEIATLEQ